MKEIRINNFEEKIFYEELDNGLKVYLLPLMKKNNYLITYAVKYGSRNVLFKINDKEIETPTGIAHFLEHKMFEREDDPFSFYEKTGTDVNAATSFDHTQYYILGSKNFEENLAYMINWLKSVDITEEQVEKEKGIILEEASMYKDYPTSVLNEKARENIFVKDPYRNKIIGTDKDIKRITKEDIDLCFESFYTPENMIIIITGKFDKDLAIKTIRENTKDIKRNKNKIVKTFHKEPDKVHKKNETIEFNVDIPREIVSYKFNKNVFKALKVSDYELNIYLHIIINMALGLTSKIREEWVKRNLFLNSFYRITETNTHYVIEFSAVTNYPDELKKELLKYLKDIKIDKSAFEREKKLWISSEIESLNNIQRMKYSILDDNLDYGDFIPNKIEIIRNLKYDKIELLKELLVFKNEITVKLVPKK